MHPGQETQSDKLPGISAVLVAQAALAGSTELEGAVLDLAAVLDGLVCGNFEIIVVNATSPPHAAELADELRARCPSLPVRVQAAQAVGEETALAAGFDAAAYDLILVSGANGEMDVREANHLLEAVEDGADLAIGYRPRRADGFIRRLHGWGWNALVGLLFGKTGRDVDCPFKLFRSVVWQSVDLRPRKPGRTFNAELLIRARALGFNVAEVPVSHRRPHVGEPRRAAGPTEISRALVELGQLRRGISLETSAASGQLTSLSPSHSTRLRLAHSMHVAAGGEQRHSQEPRCLSPDL
jgi:Glycosyl transferase family 2